MPSGKTNPVVKMKRLWETYFTTDLASPLPLAMLFDNPPGC